MGKTRPVDPTVEKYFAEPGQSLHRQYLALRSFFLEGDAAEVVAAKYRYKVSTVYNSLARFDIKSLSDKMAILSASDSGILYYHTRLCTHH